MELRPIELNIDTSQELYSSINCRHVIDAITGSYINKGFNTPWVGYFAFKNNQVVGTGGVVEKLRNGKVEIAYWTFNEFEGQGVATFICKALIEIWSSADKAISIIAKTAPNIMHQQKFYSTAVLLLRK